MDKLGIGDSGLLPKEIPVAALKTILATSPAIVKHSQAMRRVGR
jgi:hypothetical protein